MRVFKFFAFALLGVLACVSFASCSDDDDKNLSEELLGTWVCVESTYTNPTYRNENGFAVNDALIFFDGYFKSEDKLTSALAGKKCFDVHGDAADDLSEYTELKWNQMVEWYGDEQEFEPIYQVSGNTLSIIECDLDRYVGTFSVSGDELVFTYKYQNWKYETGVMVDESEETYVSKFVRK